MPLRPVLDKDTAAAVFVSRQTGASRLEIGVDKFDEMVRDHTLPPPAVVHGKVIRWHWPTIEAAFLTPMSEDDDPYLRGVNHAKGAARRPA